MTTAIKGYETLANEKTFARLYADVNVLDQDSCWNWAGTKTADGYGLLTRYVDGKAKVIFAHRLSWYSQNGVIPEGMVVDHTCHTADMDNCKGECKHRSCINPAHLRVIPFAENVRLKRANSKAFNNLGLMHPEDRGSCINGHLFFEGSYAMYKNNRRVCKECQRVSARKSAAKKVGA